MGAEHEVQARRDLFELRLETLEQRLLLGPRRTLVPPRCGLKPDDHAEYDDQQFQRDGKPVLLAHGLRQSSEDGVRSPRPHYWRLGVRLGKMVIGCCHTAKSYWQAIGATQRVPIGCGRHKGLSKSARKGLAQHCSCRQRILERFRTGTEARFAAKPRQLLSALRVD